MRTIVVLSALLCVSAGVVFAEETVEKKKDEFVLHIHDLRPLLQKGSQSSRDSRDVQVRAMINVLKDATGQENWIAGDATIRELDGLLYVKQRESVHARLRQTLADLVKETGAEPVASGQPAAPKAPDEWSLHAYDLRSLTEGLTHFDNIYSTGRIDKDKTDDQKNDELISVLKEASGAGNWTGEDVSIREIKGLVYVHQRESVHARIRQTLATLVRERKTQVRVQIRTVKCAEPPKTQFTPSEFSDFLSKEGAGADVNQAQLVCCNGQSAVTFGGREQPFIESFVANTEGGGNVAGAREAAGSPILEGLSVIVRPLIAPDGKSVELTLRLGLISHINFRKPTLSEVMMIEMAKVPVQKKAAPKPVAELKTADAAKTEAPAAEPPDAEKLDQDRIDLFGMPVRESGRLSTTVLAPRGRWMLVGSFKSPPEETKAVQVFVKVEVEE